MYLCPLTAISLQADMDIPVPSICFNAYSFSSFLHMNKKNYFFLQVIFKFKTVTTKTMKCTTLSNM